MARLRIGIADKVVLLFICLGVFWAVLLAWYVIGQQQKMLMSEFDDRAGVLLSGLVVSCRYPVLQGNLAALEKIGRSCLRQKDVAYCEVRDAEGGLLFRGGSENERYQRVYSYRLLDDPGADGAPREIGTISLILSLADVTRKLGGIQRNIAVLVLFGAGVACLLITLLVRLVVRRPVNELLRGIEVIASGNLEYAVPVRTTDELGSLAASFNMMTADLRQTEAEKRALLGDLEVSNLKLKESNQELQDFVYIASHDLREPARKISAFGDILAVSLEGRLDDDQIENLGFLVDGARRMQEMIDALLVYSRVTTKARPFDTVELNEVIDNLTHVELALRLEETEGAIQRSTPLPAVNADRAQIHQLLQNLIGNALKYCRPGVPPRVTVTAESSTAPGMVKVRVQDNGIGIGEEYREDIFVMFRRLHGRGEYEGTGIGLAVCRKIVERHGGEIGVDSVAGEGSTFWFTVPAAAPNAGH